MRIDSGLFDHMVLQRGPRGVAVAEFAGTAAAAGALVACVKRSGKALRGWTARPVGSACGGKFRGRLAGLPAGGPYTVELRIATRAGKPERLTVRDVLVGDVWIAAGQSNMQGCGRQTAAAPPHSLVRAFYMDDRWAVARDPIHNLWACVDEVHVDLGVIRGGPPNTVTGVGPAVAFAQEMFRRTGVPQGILACAHGGTSMAQWDPALKALGTKSLYGATVRRVRKNGGRVAGVIWYQGESDANADAAPHYTQRMRALVRALRRDCRDPRLPLAVVQLGRVINGAFPAAAWLSIQEQQRQFCARIPGCAVVPAMDLRLDDAIHISGSDQNRLGRRLAYAMDVLRRGAKAGRPPLAPGRLRAVFNPRCGAYDLHLDVRNVHGRLHVPEGTRPTGFAIGDPKPSPAIFDTECRGSTVILRTAVPASGLAGKDLYHGYGTDAFCNIRDEADRLLPVFGPLLCGEPRACTPPPATLRVVLPVALPPGVDLKLNGLAYPADLAALPWRLQEFPARFCDLHLAIAPIRPREFIVFYACRLTVPEPMPLRVLLGYDGPVKLWIDGRELVHDPTGTNPAVEERAKVRFDAGAGSHDVLVALSSNGGSAWGIFLAFERLGLTRRQLLAGPGSYAMPELTV